MKGSRNKNDNFYPLCSGLHSAKKTFLINKRANYHNLLRVCSSCLKVNKSLLILILEHSGVSKREPLASFHFCSSHVQREWPSSWMIVIKDIGIRNSEKQEAVMKGSSRKVSGSCDTFSSGERHEPERLSRHPVASSRADIRERETSSLSSRRRVSKAPFGARIQSWNTLNELIKCSSSNCFLLLASKGFRRKVNGW